FVHHAHTAAAEFFQDAVVRDDLPDHEPSRQIGAWTMQDILSHDVAPFRRPQGESKHRRLRRQVRVTSLASTQLPVGSSSGRLVGQPEVIGALAAGKPLAICNHNAGLYGSTRKGTLLASVPLGVTT